MKYSKSIIRVWNIDEGNDGGDWDYTLMRNQQKHSQIQTDRILHSNLQLPLLYRKGRGLKMRVLHNLKKHGQWQIDESNDEMNALLWRLQKNKTTRTQDILQHLQKIFIKQDERLSAKNKLAHEINSWKTTINDNTRKLRSLNKALLNPKDKTVAVEKIQRTGLYAAERINQTSENLHRQISIARDILENSSRLMDLKGLPMNCNNGNSHEL
ncbi:unnamed protein product [Mytilus edulis]|uniref:Uncharacterized protein n=1 Tax=Mytilus edulis TaxID=6550 RepID=A0A8S3QA51_MYTED|nr:unnamed protein product [Mytilus edulis]